MSGPWEPGVFLVDDKLLLSVYHTGFQALDLGNFRCLHPDAFIKHLLGAKPV